MRVRAIGATTLLLSAVTAVHAQAPQSTPVEKRSPLSEMAHNLSNWLNHVTGKGADRHRAAASRAPLPRPRPGQPGSAPVVSNERPAGIAPAASPPSKKTVAPVQIND